MDNFSCVLFHFNLQLLCRQNKYVGNFPLEHPIYLCKTTLCYSFCGAEKPDCGALRCDDSSIISLYSVEYTLVIVNIIPLHLLSECPVED